MRDLEICFFFPSLGLKIFLLKLVRNSLLAGSLATSDGVYPRFSSTKLVIDFDEVVIRFLEVDWVSQKLTIFFCGCGVLAFLKAGKTLVFSVVSLVAQNLARSPLDLAGLSGCSKGPY